MKLQDRLDRIARKRARGRRIRVLLVRTSRPGAAFWPEDEPFDLPSCQIVAPLGILYLASMLRRDMDDVVDVNAVSLSTAVHDESGMQDWLQREQPDVVGISALNVEREYAVTLARAVRRYDEGTLILVGGPYATYLPEECLKWTDTDVIFRGEADFTVTRLLEAASSGGDLSRVPGVGFLNGDEVVLTDLPAPIEDLDALPMPAWDMVDFESYSRMYNMLGLPLVKPLYTCLLTSRGCPYRCSFCHNYFGRRFRPRSPESVLQEMEFLYDRHGVSEFHIVDDVFNFDGDRVEAICRGILDRGLDVSLAFPNGVRGDIFDRSQLELLARAGCFSMCLSLESASPRIQKLMHKRLNLPRLGETVRTATDLGIITKLIFMVGYPSETRDEMQMTLDWVRDSACDLPQHSIACPLPGTEMHEHAKAFNPDFHFSLRSTEDYNAFKPLTAMDEKEFRKILSRGVAEMLSVPERVRRLKQIRAQWPPEAERYFDWTLDGAVPGMPVRGGPRDAIARDELVTVLDRLAGENGLEPHWEVEVDSLQVVSITEPGRPTIRLRVSRRDDTKERMASTASYNLTYLPDEDVQPDQVGDLLSRVIEGFQRIDDTTEEHEAPRVARTAAPPASLALVFPPWAPLHEHPEGAIPYLRAFLARRGHESVVLDLNAEFVKRCSLQKPAWDPAALQPVSLRLDDVQEYVMRGDTLWDGEATSFLERIPESVRVVGLSIVAATQVPPALILARHLREQRPRTRIVLGGLWCAGAIHLLQELLRRFPFIDAAVPYDGERPLLDLLTASPTASCEDLPGFVTAGSMMSAGRRPAVAVQHLPAPDFSDLPLADYPVLRLPVRSRRGCTWGRCMHCVQLHPGDRRASACVPPDELVTTMETLAQRTGVNDFALANHLTPPEELSGIADAILARSAQVSWSSLARFDRKLDLPLLRKLSRAGCRHLHYGLECIRAEDLSILRKGIREDTVRRILDESGEAGLGVAVSVMSFPGQSQGGFRETLEFLLDWAPILKSVTPIRFALPRHAPIYRQPQRMGMTLPPDGMDLDVFQLPYHAQQEITQEEFSRIVADFQKKLAARKAG